MLALLVLAVVVGGALQRVTGMGFGLVAGPFIVLLLGPLEGVLMVNLLGAASSLLILGRVSKGVDWRRYAWLAAASLAVMVPAALLLRGAGAATLEITIGTVVILAMTLALVTSRLAGARDAARNSVRGGGTRRSGAAWPLLVTGAASGFGSVAAGIGGPPLAVYAVLDRWDPRAFAATAQPFFLTNASAALVAKLLLTEATFPVMEPWAWVAVGGAAAAGIGVGELLAPRVSREATRRVLVVLAYLGGIATLVRGLAELIG